MLSFKRRGPKPERQELWCHDCERYVQFTLDLSLNGNHVLNCPNCGHEHCRVVKDGKITDIRWDSRNGPNIPAIGNLSSSVTSTYTNYSASGGSSTFLYQSWMNSSSGGN